MEAIIVAMIVGVSVGYLLHNYLKVFQVKKNQHHHDGACGGCAIKEKCSTACSPGTENSLSKE